MELHKLIINDVAPIAITEQVKRAQDIFSQMTYSHIPVMENDLFIGSIAETDAHCFESNQSITDLKYSLESFHVDRHTHWLEVLKSFAQNHSNIMPVLDDDKGYLGYYELNDIMEHFTEAPFLYESGNVIVVSKGATDYSFSEITQIVESNGATIYGCFLSAHRGHLAEITIKLSGNNLNAVVQTFRRYSYEIVSSIEDDTYLDALKERSDYLDKYLNI